MPPGLLAETGVIPFSQTIFLWQSMLCAVVLVDGEHLDRLEHRTGCSPRLPRRRRSASICRIAATAACAAGRGSGWNTVPLRRFSSPLLGAVFLAHEFAVKGFVAAISNLNTYNLLFIVAALVLQWRPRRFIDAVARSVPGRQGCSYSFRFSAPSPRY